MYLADLNGPKGGVDKLCQIIAKLSHGNPVVILEKGTEVLPTVIERHALCIASWEEILSATTGQNCESSANRFEWPEFLHLIV